MSASTAVCGRYRGRKGRRRVKENDRAFLSIKDSQYDGVIFEAST